MKKLLFLLLFSYSFLFGQAKINFRNYQSEKDSLLNLNSKLLIEKKSLLKEIDSLKNLSNLLEEKINSANREIEELFIKKFGKENGTRVYNKQVWKGMTEKMLLAGWGKPDKIDKNVQKWGTYTQWYYGKITFFFKDGKLIDFEESK
ncbi:MAG: hypothetical protein WHS65_10310 [Melioribacteraceae bacterium]